MTIQYITGDLFSNTDAVLLHACNCKRSWGKGVAATFATKFPRAYEIHRTFIAVPGDIQVIEGDRQTIVCLFTSKGYGRDTDPPLTIAKNTEIALEKLALHYKDQQVVIASPMLNAGLFRVPWRNTENLINYFLDNNLNITWKVYVIEE